MCRGYLQLPWTPKTQDLTGFFVATTTTDDTTDHLIPTAHARVVIMPTQQFCATQFKVPPV